jgi:hypothetical protein
MPFKDYIPAPQARETILAAEPRNSSGDSGPLTGYGQAKYIRAQLLVTEATGYLPTLDVVIEDTVDEGRNWNPIGAFAQVQGEGYQMSPPILVVPSDTKTAEDAAAGALAIDATIEPVPPEPAEQKPGCGRQVINVTEPFSDVIRIRWTIGGEKEPAFTFAIDWVCE